MLSFLLIFIIEKKIFLVSQVKKTSILTNLNFHCIGVFYVLFHGSFRTCIL